MDTPTAHPRHPVVRGQDIYGCSTAPTSPGRRQRHLPGQMISIVNAPRSQLIPSHWSRFAAAPEPDGQVAQTST
jgi:hypothetical protein